MAEDYDVDLVEVAPNAQPPVCRLMDYGKFRYQEQKKAQEMKARQKVIQVKDVKFRPATDENDTRPSCALCVASWPMATRPRSRCVIAAVKWPTRTWGLRSCIASATSSLKRPRSNCSLSLKGAK